MQSKSYQWAVIGAGPAGIAAIGKLIDHQVEPKNIIWIDPEFRVGDFGTKWRKVSSNTKVDLFLKFLNASPAFEFKSAQNNFDIQRVTPAETCLLSLVADPLQWITHKLQNKVASVTDTVKVLHLNKRHWHLSLSNSMITAKNIIMAPGAEPKSLHFSEIKEIPLSTALDPDRLNKAYDKEDTVAIFGSSHSAMLAIQNLIEAGKAKRIINFFLEPLRYAVYFDDWILFDDTGLKGNAAIWARENIDGQWPEKLSRILSTQENIHLHLPSCNKVIYATGFQRRSIPIDGMQNPLYNEQNGIIAPGLFGLGIAFPEARVDRYGTLEYRVGLWKFVDYLSRVLPLWIKYPT